MLTESMALIVMYDAMLCEDGSMGEILYKQ